MCGYLAFFSNISFQISDIRRIHRETCASHCQDEFEEQPILLSLDGVAETKSTNTSLDVYSLKFKRCKDIYPIQIIRPLNKLSIEHKSRFSDVLSDLSNNQLLLLGIIADNPKRSFLRDSVHHSGRFACEYCFQPGVTYRSTTKEESEAILAKIERQKNEIFEKLKNEKNKKNIPEVKTLENILESLKEAEKMAKKQRQSTHIVWPANTRDGELRNKEKVLDIVSRIEANEGLSQAERKGIKGRSLLLDIEHFDYISGVQTEYMHLVCLGIVKRLLEQCFSIGETRSRVLKSPLASPNNFNELMKKIKVVREFSRRARHLDLSVMKAQELRNILLFFYPLVIECLESDHEKKLWEMLAFMVRACIIPDIEFQNVNINHVKYCQRNVYVLWEQIFGPRNCTYSLHVFCSHLLTMRESGPLTETSAFSFEAFYAELRRAFQPGTVSVLKQMFQSVLLKRILSKHSCAERIVYKEKDTALECNSLIYVYENSCHVMYKIISIDQDNFICNKLGNHPIESKLTSMLNWSSVGVYRKGGQCSLEVPINREDVAGKVIKVDKYLITCPVNILREK